MEARKRPDRHGQLCGLIYARKFAVTIAERCLLNHEYTAAVAATKLAATLDAEYIALDLDIYGPREAA